MNENIERLSELVRKPQLTMIGAPPTINALAFARQVFGPSVEFRNALLDDIRDVKDPEKRKAKKFLFELQSIFEEEAQSEARSYDRIMCEIKQALVHEAKRSVLVLADFTKNAYNSPAELSSFTGNARLVYTADAVLAMQRFQNAIRVSCLKAPWNDYAAWKEPLVDFFVEYDPESQTFHEVPAPEITPLEDLSRINTRKRSARK